VDGWSVEDSQEIVVGRRRMRVGRRRSRMRGYRWIVSGVVVVVVAGLAYGGYLLFRPSGLAALPAQAIVAPGGFRASIGANKTITVGLEIRNAADVPLTVVGAKITPPAGLTSVATTVVPTGENNAGFTLDGDLPAARPFELGTEAANRNGIVAARFTVDCGALTGTAGPSGEQILVTIQVGDEERVEQLTPPVVGDEAWLSATANRVCFDPIPTGPAPTPLPPLPG
jgi:hypothetical protein